VDRRRGSPHGDAIVSDEGPITGAQLVAQGPVTDQWGSPVAGVVGWWG